MKVRIIPISTTISENTQSVTKIDNLQPSTSPAHLIESIEKDFKIPDSSKDDEYVPVPPAPKRQKSILSSFEEINVFSASGHKSLKINNALFYMVCKDNQPFTIVENEGFRNLIKVIAPHYKLPNKTTLTRWLMINTQHYQQSSKKSCQL